MDHDNFGIQFTAFLVALTPVVALLIWAASVWGPGQTALGVVLFSYTMGVTKGVFGGN